MIKSSLPDIFYTDELKRVCPSVFLYALAGAGKTYALRTLAPRNPLVLATETGNTKGLGTLADLHIASIPINSMDEVDAIISELAANATSEGLFYKHEGPFKALAVDSLTGIGPYLENALKKLKGWNMIWDAHSGGKKDPRSAYPYINERGRQLMDKLMALPVPLVVTCREQSIIEGEGENAIRYSSPELPGSKLPKELPGWVEATVRLTIVNRQRVFVTQNEGHTIARVRLSGTASCGRYIKPDLHLLLQALEGDMHAVEGLKIDTSIPRTPQQRAAQNKR